MARYQVIDKIENMPEDKHTWCAFHPETILEYIKCMYYLWKYPEMASVLLLVNRKWLQDNYNNIGV